MKQNKDLILAVDMYGCPNRGKHCWLGQLQNKALKKDTDKKIVEYFKLCFNSVTFYGWLVK